MSNCTDCLPAQKQITRLGRANHPYSHCYYNSTDDNWYPRYQEDPDSDKV